MSKIRKTIMDMRNRWVSAVRLQKYVLKRIDQMEAAHDAERTVGGIAAAGGQLTALRALLNFMESVAVCEGPKEAPPPNVLEAIAILDSIRSGIPSNHEAILRARRALTDAEPDETRPTFREEMNRWLGLQRQIASTSYTNADPAIRHVAREVADEAYAKALAYVHGLPVLHEGQTTMPIDMALNACRARAACAREAANTVNVDHLTAAEMRGEVRACEAIEQAMQAIRDVIEVGRD